MRVIAYTRVSTEDQANEGVSLEAQETRLRAYCVVKGWELERVECDAGKSAKNLERPALQRILSEQLDFIDVVLVCKLDRLTRDIVDLNRLLKLFETHNVKLVSLEENLDATTPTGELMLNLVAAISQWERKQTAARVKQALQHLKSQGKALGKPAYGFEVDGSGKLRPIATEQAVIAKITQLKSAGASYRSVAITLADQGVPTKRGGQWDSRTVQRIHLAASTSVKATATV
jgi:site-specific DNA recombinase